MGSEEEEDLGSEESIGSGDPGRGYIIAIASNDHCSLLVGIASIREQVVSCWIVANEGMLG